MWRSLFIAIGSCMLLWSASNCGASKQQAVTFVTNPPFTIAEASLQEWVAGIPQGGSGYNLRVQLTSPLKEATMLRFHLHSKQTEAVYIASENQYVGYFKEQRGDIEMSSDPTVEANNTPPKRSALNLDKNEAVIEYKMKGKRYYYKIPKLSIKEPLSYPSNAPKDDQ